MIGLLLISELFIHVDVYSIIRRHIISTQCLPGLVAQLPQKGVGVVGLIPKSKPLGRHGQRMEATKHTLVRQIAPIHWPFAVPPSVSELLKAKVTTRTGIGVRGDISGICIAQQRPFSQESPAQG